MHVLDFLSRLGYTVSVSVAILRFTKRRWTIGTTIDSIKLPIGVAIRVDAVDGGYRIDLAPLDAVRTFLVEDEFFISLKDKTLPSAVEGASLFVHDCRPDHVVYRAVRHPGASTVSLLM